MDRWFKKWFDSNYLLLYYHRNRSDALRQVDLILKETVPDKSWKILDLCCGEGRHMMLFREKGYELFGMDLSWTLLLSGKSKFGINKMIRGDMRLIPGKFDMILSLFTSFGYFMKEEDNQRVINEIGNSLNSGGTFWLDFLNPFYVEKTLVKRSEKRLPGDIKAIEERDIRNGRVEKKITFINNGEKKIYRESVRLYYKNDLVKMLAGAGFRVENVFGDYQGGKHKKLSPRIIIFAKKS